MDSTSLVMGLADVQALTNNFLTLIENIVLLAETPLYFLGFRNSFSIFINLSHRSEISSY